MDEIAEGTRVFVRPGDGRNVLHRGTYVGVATVYFVRTNASSPRRSDSTLVTFENPEQMPSEADIASVPDGELVRLEGNPKIVLDDGRVVYGCQVWWEPMPTAVQLSMDLRGFLSAFYVHWVQEQYGSDQGFRLLVTEQIDVAIKEAMLRIATAQPGKEKP